ncbi:MAG: N-formylglutamate amidohydrolase [Desulfobulbaceae bacterium]|nr:N-formylglutamate amidohydrolase [Desulfobulbaceae bacterium]
MKLPFLISVPHGSLQIPAEIQDICLLSTADILQDSDEEAEAIYSSLKGKVLDFVMADIARAAVDLNRASDDIGGDGVIKTHTCYGRQVYEKFPDQQIISLLLKRYYTPYHAKLSRAQRLPGVKLAIDCHTMAEVGPPVSPDVGQKRPLICLSNADSTCPMEWVLALAAYLQDIFSAEEVTVNKPFRGGYTVRRHAVEMPWLQIEFSRTGTVSTQQKSAGLILALEQLAVDKRFCF